MTIQTNLVDYVEHQTAITLIRFSVFSQEQGVDPAIDFDGLDREALHVVSYDDDEPVGTGRILEDGHIGRVCVMPRYRSRGIGTRIMEVLIETAREKGIKEVHLYAQVDAVPFYDRLGFSACGENFEEAGMMHTPMVLKL